MSKNEIGKIVVDAAYVVHTRLGPGLLESVYETAFAYELHKRGVKVQQQVPIPVFCDDVRIDEGFRGT